MFVSGHVNFLLIQCLLCVLANKDNTNIRHASKNNDVDGHWTTWKSWGQCTKSCGNGVRQRIRSCTDPRPQNGGLNCPDTSRQFSSCNKQSCPVNGHWSSWTRWSSCSRTCGNGTKQRTRACDNPKPKYGGNNCLGYRKMTAACSRLPHCPIHGHWSGWSIWSSCSRTCGSGTMQRTRKCNNPAPKHGGHSCTGQRKMTKGCSRLPPCPIHGHWSGWSRWSSCSKTCGSGTILRTRTCNNPLPKYGGHNCHGYRKETSVCSKLPPCPGQSFRTISCSTATCPTTVSLIKLTTAFAQASKVKSTTLVPKFAWQTINIPPGKRQLINQHHRRL